MSPGVMGKSATVRSERGATRIAAATRRASADRTATGAASEPLRRRFVNRSMSGDTVDGRARGDGGAAQDRGRPAVGGVAMTAHGERTDEAAGWPPSRVVLAVVSPSRWPGCAGQRTGRPRPSTEARPRPRIDGQGRCVPSRRGLPRFGLPPCDAWNGPVEPAFIGWPGADRCPPGAGKSAAPCPPADTSPGGWTCATSSAG